VKVFNIGVSPETKAEDARIPGLSKKERKRIGKDPSE
jgi:hypothetical protein